MILPPTTNPIFVVNYSIGDGAFKSFCWQEASPYIAERNLRSGSLLKICSKAVFVGLRT
jgi:hypothetical protein